MECGLVELHFAKVHNQFFKLLLIVETVKQIFCPDLDDPQNGDVNVDGPQRPGQIAQYSCDGGFTLVGSKTRRCLSNGVWSGRAPFCKSTQSIL
jgi:hypothetical protein